MAMRPRIYMISTGRRGVA